MRARSIYSWCLAWCLIYNLFFKKKTPSTFLPYIYSPKCSFCIEYLEICYVKDKWYRVSSYTYHSSGCCIFWNTISLCSQKLRGGLILCKTIEKCFLRKMTFKMGLRIWVEICERERLYFNKRELLKHVQSEKKVSSFEPCSPVIIYKPKDIFRFICYIGNVLMFWSLFLYIYLP